MDPYDLQRFVSAQTPVIEQVLLELAAGRKRSHWMWFVFPQLAALGASATAKHYGLASLDEARAYWAHPLLRTRLRDCCGTLLRVDGRTAREIFGSPDDLKLRSCLTLFEIAAPEEPLFATCLEKFYGGGRDQRTLSLCAAA